MLWICTNAIPIENGEQFSILTKAARESLVTLSAKTAILRAAEGAFGIDESRGL